MAVPVTEVGTFTPANASETLYFNNEFLKAVGIEFKVYKTLNTAMQSSTGFTDGTRNRAVEGLAKTGLFDTRGSTTYSMYEFADVSGTPTVKVAGKVPTTGLDTVGEFTADFDNYDSSYSIHFYAVGYEVGMFRKVAIRTKRMIRKWRDGNKIAS